MSKKLFISIAPLLAIAAFVVMPAAAQAALKWNVNGIPTAPGEHTSVIMWGGVTYHVAGGTEFTCENAAIADVYNNASPPSGEVEAFATADCESATYCPGESIEVVGERLLPAPAGWPMFIHESAPPRVDFPGPLTLRVWCVNSGGSKTLMVMGLHPGSPFGAVEPLAPFGAKKGTSAKSPGFFEYDVGSGNLENESTKALVHLEGEVKILGYEEQELINIK